jgi:hypothetical protein
MVVALEFFQLATNLLQATLFRLESPQFDAAALPFTQHVCLVIVVLLILHETLLSSCIFFSRGRGKLRLLIHQLGL